MKAKERLQQVWDKLYAAERDYNLGLPGAAQRLQDAHDEAYDIEVALDDEREDRQR